MPFQNSQCNSACERKSLTAEASHFGPAVAFIFLKIAMIAGNERTPRFE
jgi:hypothetical protein